MALLAQEDDGDVRAACALALPPLASACTVLRAADPPRADALAVTLLDAAFALVEDDVEAVVAAAEAAVPALVALVRPLDRKSVV